MSTKANEVNEGQGIDEIPAIEPLESKDLGLKQMIRTDRIIESQTNPRRVFEDLDGLAASILRDGVIQPLIVRKLKQEAFENAAANTPGAPGGSNGEYVELICGARRLRAATKAGVLKVPCFIVSADDEQAREFQLVENGQRRDVHPMDEARGFHDLMQYLGGAIGKSGLNDPYAECAARVGRTPRYVYQRLSLLVLPEAFQEKFRAGDYTLDVALQIARLPNEAVRLRAVEELETARRVFVSGVDGEIKTVLDPAHARAVLRKAFMLRLADAPFDRNDAELVPAAGQCTVCPKATGYGDRGLFRDLAEDALCTDAACYAEKVDASWKEKAEAAVANGTEVLTQKASEKVFYRSGQIDYASGLLDLDEKNYKDAKHRTWKQMLGKKVATPVLTRDPAGNPRTLYRRTEIMKLVGGKDADEDGVGATEKTIKADREAAKRLRERLRIEREARARGLAEAVKQVEAGGEKTSVDYLRLLATLLLSEFGDGKEQGRASAIAKARDFRTVKALIEKGTAAQLRGAIYEAAIGDVAFSFNAQERLPKLLKLHRIDLKAVEASIREEEKEKAKV